MAEHAAEMRATDAKTTRLKALRLEREAADKLVADAAVKPGKKVKLAAKSKVAKSSEAAATPRRPPAGKSAKPAT